MPFFGPFSNAIELPPRASGDESDSSFAAQSPMARPATKRKRVTFAPKGPPALPKALAPLSAVTASRPLATASRPPPNSSLGALLSFNPPNKNNNNSGGGGKHKLYNPVVTPACPDQL